MSAAGGQELLAFLGVPADPRLLDDDVANLPRDEQRPAERVETHTHDQLVRVGSLLTGATLVGGVALVLYASWRLLAGGADTFRVALLGCGVTLAVTHWGWVHLAEYVGLKLDARAARSVEASNARWLASIEPYPRFSVVTDVLPDASIRVRRLRHRPLLSDHGTFTFKAETNYEQIFEADTSAEVIASAVEEMRRKARLDSDRLRAHWRAASDAYDAALFSSQDERHRLAARRAAAVALSEHINASLLEQPLVE